MQTTDTGVVTEQQQILNRLADAKKRSIEREEYAVAQQCKKFEDELRSSATADRKSYIDQAMAFLQSQNKRKKGAAASRSPATSAGPTTTMREPKKRGRVCRKVRDTKRCGVCESDSAVAKYQCSKCRIPYCGIPCFRKHREEQKDSCEAKAKKRDSMITSAKEDLKRRRFGAVLRSIRKEKLVLSRGSARGKQNSAASSKAMRDLRIEEQKRKLPSACLEKLKRCREIRELLKSAPLRTQIKQIAGQTDLLKCRTAIECALAQSDAGGRPNFRRFADAVLSATGFLTPVEVAGRSEVLMQFSRGPIATSKRRRIARAVANDGDNNEEDEGTSSSGEEGDESTGSSGGSDADES